MTVIHQSCCLIEHQLQTIHQTPCDAVVCNAAVVQTRQKWFSVYGKLKTIFISPLPKKNVSNFSLPPETSLRRPTSFSDRHFGLEYRTGEY